MLQNEQKLKFWILPGKALFSLKDRKKFKICWGFFKKNSVFLRLRPHSTSEVLCAEYVEQSWIVSRSFTTGRVGRQKKTPKWNAGMRPFNIFVMIMLYMFCKYRVREGRLYYCTPWRALYSLKASSGKQHLFHIEHPIIKRFEWQRIHQKKETVIGYYQRWHL